MTGANIFLTGFSGAGKTTVGRIAADLLGWRYVDMDDEIEAAAGRTIPEIFEIEGETAFRRYETDVLSRLSAGSGQIVSTGGGVPVAEANRALMSTGGLVVCLEARPETVFERLSAERDRPAGPVVRPMLSGADPMRRIRDLKAERQPSYSLADWTVQTDRLSPEQAASEVARAWDILRAADAGAGDDDLAAVVRTSSGDYPVWVGWGLLDDIGEKAAAAVSPGAAYVVTDEGAYLHGRRAQASLEAAGVPCHIFALQQGEAGKTLEGAARIYEWLASLKAERGHLVAAVGGGVVGDMAGFAAATYLRGMPFAQVPTTMLAMMDAAVGGKTAVDLPYGKNLVGAFHQPRLVLADVAVLKSLPEREINSGWAEAIKHGLIMDAGLFQDFERRGGAVRSLDPATTIDIVKRSVAVKADVVTRDEKERLGLRVLLNYGHTVGHAIEAATGYTRYLHGEAVSIGMTAAARIGLEVGLMSEDETERQRQVLQDFRLPVSLDGADGVDPAALKEAMTLDKKTVGGAIRWVLLDGIGRAVTRGDVPESVVDAALESLGGRS